MSWSRADLDDLASRVRTMLQRGTVRTVADAPKMQTLDVALKSGQRPSKVEHWHPYGIATHPLDGSEVLTAALGGNPDHVIVIATADRRYRIKVAAGEVALHDDQGQKVHLMRDGVLVDTPKKATVKAGEAITVESAAGITLKGPVHVIGDITQEGSIESTGVHKAAGHI